MADFSFSLGDVLTLLGTVVTVLIAYLKLKSSISAVEKGNSAIKEVLTAYSKSFGSLIGHLAKKNKLTTIEVTDIYNAGTSQAVDNLLNMLVTSGAGNPITPQEAQRLQSYYNKMQMGYGLTQEEVQDFYNLSNGVSQDHPNDAGALLLVGLAALAVGYFMGLSDKDDKSKGYKRKR